jgi:hypothetical protein
MGGREQLEIWASHRQRKTTKFVRCLRGWGKFVPLPQGMDDPDNRLYRGGLYEIFWSPPSPIHKSDATDYKHYNM